MMDVKPAWNYKSPATIGRRFRAEMELLRVQGRLLHDVEQLARIADAFSDAGESPIGFLIESAHMDLVAGTELARCGYPKQAYSLWRAWFEQSLFAIYFREAPLHQQAWKVSKSIGIDDNPQYRLMLHQLLNDSGERHPFSIVYQQREELVATALKVGPPAKKDRLVARASRTLTLLSQGVHGTYQPSPATSRNLNQEIIEKHCTWQLTEAAEIVRRFWILFVVSRADLSEEFILGLRDGKPAVELIAELDMPQNLDRLYPIFNSSYGKK